MDTHTVPTVHSDGARWRLAQRGREDEVRRVIDSCRAAAELPRPRRAAGRGFGTRSERTLRARSHACRWSRSAGPVAAETFTTTERLRSFTRTPSGMSAESLEGGQRRSRKLELTALWLRTASRSAAQRRLAFGCAAERGRRPTCQKHRERERAARLPYRVSPTAASSIVRIIGR